VHNLLGQLSRRHRVTLLSFIHPGQSVGHATQAAICERVDVVPARAYRPGSLRALGGYFSSQPRWLVDVYSREMAELAKSTVSQAASAGDPFDVIIASQITMAPYLVNLQGPVRVLEELEMSILWDGLSDGDHWRRLRAGLRWRKFAGYVGRLVREHVDGCSLVSEPERVNLERIVPHFRDVAVVPNGVDVAHYSGSFGVPAPDTLVFSGALTYSANYDAMGYFLGDIWPRVREVRPAAQLAITGGTDGVALDRLPLGDGVILTGYLPDIRPRVATSRVCVVPLRQGGGTRLKILEAMALGTPVISTHKGAEGLDVTHGEDILLADTPEAFAEGVLRLLADDELCARLTRNGRRLVESRYDWAPIAERLDGLLHDVVAKKGA
jgi:glycosyltransferase involved in cell wall biosynthesis